MADRAGGFTGGADTSIYRVPETNMLDTMGKAIGLARQSTGLEQDQFNLQMGRLGALNAHLSSLIADPEVQAGGPGAMKKITEVGGRLVSMGIVPAKDLTVAISGINPTNPIAALRQAQLNTLSAQERMNAVYGTPMVINDGQTQRVMRQSPFMGAVVPQQGGTIQNQPGPSELLTRVPGPPDPRTGAPTTTTLGGAAMGEGALNPNGTINLGPSAAQAPNRLIQSTQPQGVLQRPANPLPVQQPQQQPAQARSPLPAPAQPQRGVQAPAPAAGPSTANIAWGSTVTGLPPGQAEAQRISGEASGTQLAGDIQHAATITQKIYPLRNAIVSLERLGKTGTGPGSEQFNQFKSFIQTLGIPGVDQDKVKDFDSAKKFLTDYVNRMTPRSDAQLVAAVSGNPSVTISNAAAVDLAKSAVAIERMRAAQAKAFQATGKPDAEYTRWGAQWNGTQDPRAYAIDLMGPEKFNKLRKELEKDPAAYARFKASYAIAKREGLIPGPTQQGQ